MKNARFTILLLACCFFSSREIRAQDFPPQLLSQVPTAAQKLLSDDIAERASLLDQLVVPVPRSCTLEQSLPFDLTRADYLFVVSKILEKDTSVLEEKRRPEVLSKIVYLIVKFELRESASQISKYLLDRDWHLQYPALQALDALGAKEFDADVAQLLSSDQKFIREEALRTLVRFGSKKSVPTLISLLYDPNHLKRYYALTQLVLVNGREASPHIAKLLRDEESNNRYWALDTLVKLNAKERAGDIWFLTTGQTPQIEAYAIAALVYFGDKKAVEIAGREIAEPVEGRDVLRNLIELKAKAIVPVLIALLENPPKSTPVYGRSDIVYALGKLGAKESAPVLRSYIFRYPMTRVAAIQVLGDFEDKDSVNDLLNIFLTVPNDSTETAIALAKIGDDKTWKALIDAAENPRFLSRTFVIQELNKHINPALWKRVEEAKVTGMDFKSIKENAEAFARESAIRIDLEYDPTRHFFKFDAPGEYPGLRVSPKEPLKQGLKDIVATIDRGTQPNRFTYIMDGDRIRILPIEEAIKWWRTNILKSKISD